MDDRQIQSKLMGLAAQEQTLRERALAAVASNDDLILHLGVTEAAMDLIVLLQQSPRDAGDQDKAALTLLSMRLFNSLGSSLTLMLTGYYQSSAMVLRDVHETIFLLDYLLTDPARVTRWRSCTPKERDREFKQVNIRTELDARDGFTSMKRAEQYKMFCSLASHPTPDGFAMLRPKRPGSGRRSFLRCERLAGDGLGNGQARCSGRRARRQPASERLASRSGTARGDAGAQPAMARALLHTMTASQ